MVPVKEETDQFSSLMPNSLLGEKACHKFWGWKRRRVSESGRRLGRAFSRWCSCCLHGWYHGRTGQKKLQAKRRPTQQHMRLHAPSTPMQGGTGGWKCVNDMRGGVSLDQEENVEFYIDPMSKQGGTKMNANVKTWRQINKNKFTYKNLYSSPSILCGCFLRNCSIAVFSGIHTQVAGWRMSRTSGMEFYLKLF